MNSKKVVFLFWSTLLFGSVSGGIVGLALAPLLAWSPKWGFLLICFYTDLV
ncbi:hypothetical protein [Shouchella clausii]|uniref:hypothetical protein n=1 Tax=Shouchella clausii TaxID=79880 RepID=UPI0038736B13